MPGTGSVARVTVEHVTRFGGAAALIGGVAWLVKGLVIVVGADQPPLLFEVAPMLFGMGLVSVAHSTMPPSRRRAAVFGLAGVATCAGMVALVTELVGEVAGAALAISSLTLLVGLLTVGRVRPWPGRLAWWIGVAMVPALIVGGLLAEIDERLLELPLICLALAWMVAGWALLRARPRRIVQQAPRLGT
jgi:hypothetical protein